jgi:hypothetical protein
MSTFDPLDPFSLLRPPPKVQPSPSLLSALQKFTAPPAKPLSPEGLKRIEAFLSQQTSAPTAPQKSIVQRLRGHLSLGFRLLGENKLTKASGTQWIGRWKAMLQPLFGSVPYLKGLEEMRKRSAASGLTGEEFSGALSVANDFTDFLEATGGVASGYPVSRHSRVPATKDVLIIHGHDEVNELRLEKLIGSDFKLNPIVLLNKPGKSAPTIEKFEQYANSCSYAIALFTADDRIVTKTGEEYFQPRPNVIFETGWFVGRLGKARVLILLQDGVKIYSDFEGVNRIQFRENIEDKYRSIQAELEEAGLI